MDLTDVAAETLQRMAELERRVQEVDDHVTRSTTASKEQTLSLQAEEGRLNGRTDTHNDRLATLERDIIQAADTITSRIDASAKRTRDERAECEGQHKLTREQLAAYRAALVKMTAELDGLHRQTHKELEAIRLETSAALAATATALTQTQQHFATVTRPAVKAVSQAIGKRADTLDKYVRAQVVPTVHQDVRSVVQRLDAVQQRLTGALQAARTKVTTDAEIRCQEFKKESATDWRGATGDVEGAAKSRAQQVISHGGKQESAVSQDASSLTTVADNFARTVIALDERYREVHAVPNKVDWVLQKAGV